MKVLGGFQFGQVTFEFLPISAKWEKTLGDLPEGFIMIVYGGSGNGKTEFCLDLASEFKQLGDVAWLSYEQRHGYDLQKGVIRKKLNTKKAHEKEPSFMVIDPIANRKPGVSFLEDLIDYLRKKGSPRFIFIDSLDYTKFKFDDYTTLKEAFPNKSFVFISHAKGNAPKTSVGEKIEYDGGLGIYVHKYIAYVNKNRFGGFEPYVIYEERARDLNPDFFKKRLKAVQPGETPELDLKTPA